MSNPTREEKRTRIADAALQFTRSKIAIRLLALFLVLALWQLAADFHAPPFMARPLSIVARLPCVTGVDFLFGCRCGADAAAFWTAAGSTLWAVFQGLSAALVFGAVVGVAMGRLPLLDRILALPVNFFYTMPMVAVLPILTVWFGFSEQARMAAIFFAAFFSMVINVADGARHTPAQFLETARAHRARARHIWFEVTLLSAMPHLTAGIRLSAGQALVSAVIAEFFTAQGQGLGIFIIENVNAGTRHNEAAIGVLALAGFGLGFDGIVKAIVRNYFPWFRRTGG